MNQSLYKIENHRNEMADLLKGLAVFFMILVHITEKFLNPYYYSNPIAQTVFFLGASPAAPIFMIIMGYFIALSSRNKKETAIRGIKLIILGLGLNIALNLHLLFKIANNEFPFLNPLDYIFGVDILFLAGLSTVILSFIKFSPHPKTIALIVFILMLITLNFNEKIEFINGNFDYLASFFLCVTEWSYFPLIPWFIYPLFGFVLAQNKKLLKYFRPSMLWRILLITIFILFFIATSQYSFEISNNLSDYYNHGIKFFGYNILFLSGYWLIVKQFNFYWGNNKILVYLRWIGKNVTLFYIIQWIIIGNISTAIYQTFNLYYAIGAFVVIVASVSIIVFYLQDKIKGIKI